MAGVNHTESCNSTSGDSSPASNSKKHNRKLDVFNEVVFRLKDTEEAKQADFEEQLWNHFNRLPARYAMDVNVERAEHVLVHKKMLEDVRDPENRYGWNVGLVQGPAMSTALSKNSTVQEVSGYKQSLHPPPMFGSSANLEALDREADSSNPEDSASNANQPSSRPMFEVTFAADDRPKLLNRLTSLLGEMELNIEEAHAFSTNDGYSLDVFVVDGERYKDTQTLNDELQREMKKIKELFSSKSQLPSKPSVLSSKVAQTQANNSSPDHVEIPRDDCDVWEIDFRQLVLGKQVASGTYGELYRGTYRSQDVAVKMLKHERMNTDMEREFAQEVYIMRKIRHKNVVQFIGACTMPPNLCIVTEFMSGGSVYDFLHKRKGSFKFLALLRAATDISKGMNYLHQNNIIHRDLKAANLLMDENQVVKVADFGVARVKNTSGVMTAETGTYRWMAPEVIEHKPYDQTADVFSFGVVLWELLTREIPYEQYTPLQAAVGVVQKGLRPIIPKHTPPKFAHLLEDCWQQDPKKRPDFGEILRTLENIYKEAKDEPEKPSGAFLSGFRRGH